MTVILQDEVHEHLALRDAHINRDSTIILNSISVVVSFHHFVNAFAALSFSSCCAEFGIPGAGIGVGGIGIANSPRGSVSVTGFNGYV